MFSVPFLGNQHGPAARHPGGTEEGRRPAEARSNTLDLASPPADDVRAVAGVLGIRYRALTDGEFNHTSALVLLDEEGRILARTEQMGTKPDPEFLAAVRKATAPVRP